MPPSPDLPLGLTGLRNAIDSTSAQKTHASTSCDRFPPCCARLRRSCGRTRSVVISTNDRGAGLVGTEGFEPPTSCSQSRRSDPAELSPGVRSCCASERLVLVAPYGRLCVRRWGGEHGNRTRLTVLARHCRHLGTWLPRAEDGGHDPHARRRQPASNGYRSPTGSSSRWLRLLCVPSPGIEPGSPVP